MGDGSSSNFRRLSVVEGRAGAKHWCGSENATMATNADATLGNDGSPTSDVSAPAAATAANGPAVDVPAVGTTVELRGLVKTALRNGERGVVVAYAADGRAEVRLDAGDTVRVSAGKVAAVGDEPYRPAARYLQAKEHVYRGQKLAEDKK